MAYFQPSETVVRERHAEIKKQHAAVWVVRRSAFLPILDAAKVPPDLRDAAKAYNDRISNRLKSATATLLTPKSSRTRQRIHPLTAASDKHASLFPQQAHYMNPDFQRVWIDFCLLLSNLRDFLAEGRPGIVIFRGRGGSKLKVSDDYMAPDAAELPEEVSDVIAEWKAVLAKISTDLLKAPMDFSDSPLSESALRLNTIDKAYQNALNDFLPRFLGNKEFVVLPSGVEAWHETTSRARVALYVLKEQWIRAAWICHDDLRDSRQFTNYLKKAGLKGRWILAQESIEDKASDLAESAEDILEDAVR
jgi:hypothetical protein